MQQTEKHYYSHVLQKDMYYNVYGHAGKPCLVFASQDGMHRDFEGFGMIETIRPWIDGGMIRVFTVDSIDQESWSNREASLADRSARQESYFLHIAEEFAPLIRSYEGSPEQRILATGCSMGGTHAALALFRRPDLFDMMISMSPCFDARVLLEGQMNEQFFYNSPVDFLAGMPWNHPYLDQYRRSKIIVAIGQGRWEDDLLPGVRETDRLLAEKQVPAWFDYWGHDIDHDWPSWRLMLPYHLGLLFPLN